MMDNFTLRTVVMSAILSAALGLAYPAAETPSPTIAARPCTTGSPVVTAGYTIKYAPAVPTGRFDDGYQPEQAWSKDHVVGTYVSVFLSIPFNSLSYTNQRGVKKG